MIWIAFDGIDCTGKSSLLPMVEKELLRLGHHVRIIGEFSDSEVGELLRTKIAEKRFFSLAPAPDKSLVWAETFTLLADYFAKCELIGSNEADIFLSDRGCLSVIAYQAERILLTLGQDQERLLVTTINEIGLRPSHHILFTISKAVVAERARLRGEPELSAEEWQFLEAVQRRCLQLSSDFPSTVLSTVGATLDELMTSALRIIKVSVRRTAY